MFSSIHKKNVFIIGFILNTFFTALTISILILIINEYDFINIDWMSNINYNYIPKLILINSCFLSVDGIFGFIIFIKKFECKTLEKIYLIYSLPILILTIITLILCFTSVSNFIIKDENCLEEGEGFLKHFKYFNDLFISIDDLLCSKDCQCEINNETIYEKLLSLKNITYNKKGNKFNILSCPNNYINKLIEIKVSNNLNINEKIKKKFDFEKYAIYFKKVENEFKCVGWCNYYNSNETRINKKFNNYLFSDINKEEILYQGCANQLSKHISKMINLISLFLLLSSIFLIFIIITDYCILFDIVLEGSNYPDENFINDKSLSDKKVLKIKQNENKVEI